MHALEDKLKPARLLRIVYGIGFGPVVAFPPMLLLAFVYRERKPEAGEALWRLYLTYKHILNRTENFATN
jgi:hypothetical protein